MSDFFTERKLRARKSHRCAQCGKLVDAGQTCFRYSGVFEGDFFSSYEHTDCREAFLVLQADELKYCGMAPSLIDDVQQEWAPILAKDFPSVHARLFQKAPTP